MMGAAEIHKTTDVIVSDTYTIPAHNIFHACIAHVYLGVKIANHNVFARCASVDSI